MHWIVISLDLNVGCHLLKLGQLSFSILESKIPHKPKGFVKSIAALSIENIHLFVKNRHVLNARVQKPYLTVL